MYSNYLFENRFKKVGWIILIPSVIIGLVTIIIEFEPTLLDFNVPAIFIDEVLGEKTLWGFTNNNILNEILGVLIIVSGLLVAFSKEKEEDEFISKIRLESLVWATYINYFILLVAMLFVYDFSFLWVMIFNIFTILIFFIVRFNWQVTKLNKSLINEE